jgi:hypothetical protein
LSTIRDDDHDESNGAGDTLARAAAAETVISERQGKSSSSSSEVSAIDNQILKLFPDRVIKVSSFIDLLGSQL